MEIDGLPINSMVIFHGELLNNQMVYYIITVFFYMFSGGFVSPMGDFTSHRILDLPKVIAGGGAAVFGCGSWDTRGI